MQMTVLRCDAMVYLSLFLSRSVLLYVRTWLAPKHWFFSSDEIASIAGEEASRRTNKWGQRTIVEKAV